MNNTTTTYSPWPGRLIRRARGAVTLLMALAGLVTLQATGLSQTPGTVAAPSAGFSGVDILPVTSVTLFTTGVGYFQHDGLVSGDAEVTLAFDVDDVNDLLKSLVLQDFDGGTVEAVTYPSQDPLSRILGSFSINISDNPGLAELLTRARGEEVIIEGPRAVSGTVIGIEQRTQVTDGTALQVAVLNLATSLGMQQFVLRDLESVTFVNTALQHELQSALAVIAANRQQDKKLITIRFAGEGERRVRVGYVREVPVWKSSYRLVLGNYDTAQLQGWAMVENTGETDWVGVSVALVSGQPISFVMDLYSPIYVTRPTIRPDYGVAVAPQQYDRSIALSPSPSPPSMARASGVPSMAMEAEASDDYYYREEIAPEPIDLGQGVTVSAQSEGESTYRITHPLTVPRRGAALLPIVGTTIPAQRISIYDRSVLADRPLQAIRLTNTSDVQLPAGPATIFDGATYGGDTQIPALVDGEERLLSFAVDLHSLVIVRSSSTPEEITTLKIIDGFLVSTRRQVMTTEYVIDRAGKEGNRHLIVHPKRSGWDIVGDDPDSETQTSYRFEIDVPGSQTVSLPIVEERITDQRFALNSISDSQIVFYQSQRVIDDQTTAVLGRIRELRGVLAARESERRAIELQINEIYREQGRIRQNIEVLETDSDLYARYVTTLGEQEDQLTSLSQELVVAREAEQAARLALSSYIDRH